MEGVKISAKRINFFQSLLHLSECDIVVAPWTKRASLIRLPKFCPVKGCIKQLFYDGFIRCIKKKLHCRSSFVI
uniref:Uncharacterized protein n=1 Tax=Anguilla anguilla TaxID=7936 RepID=A0A0E9QAG2_ANGAN